MNTALRSIPLIGHFRSHVVEQSHESEIHVQLLMAVKKGETGVIGDEINFRFLIAAEHKYIFENSGCGDPREAG